MKLMVTLTPIASEKTRMALLFHSPGENGESQKRGSSDARAESGEGSRIFRRINVHAHHQAVYSLSSYSVTKIDKTVDRSRKVMMNLLKDTDNCGGRSRGRPWCLATRDKRAAVASNSRSARQFAGKARVMTNIRDVRGLLNDENYNKKQEHNYASHETKHRVQLPNLKLLSIRLTKISSAEIVLAFTELFHSSDHAGRRRVCFGVRGAPKTPKTIVDLLRYGSLLVHLTAV
ncbi:hypothetical protein WN51_00322 [Melipona quadrifasciata]|uniref:Uncharacterized protein n=1 Tax=Melipona quadrifasciata TaxID=166423 RepID=A0A0N0BFE1_9HYME|nr:hypothetical protein WN51_00322 [Melipona quadrifasciata]